MRLTSIAELLPLIIAPAAGAVSGWASGQDTAYSEAQVAAGKAAPTGISGRRYSSSINAGVLAAGAILGLAGGGGGSVVSRTLLATGSWLIAEEGMELTKA